MALLNLRDMAAHAPQNPVITSAGITTPTQLNELRGDLLHGYRPVPNPTHLTRLRNIWPHHLLSARRRLHRNPLTL
jgi:hypothetical protein